MHYRNGREAKNGDQIVQLTTSQPVRVTGVGVLFDAVPGNNYCNGRIAPTLGGPVVGACLCDCLHADDLAQYIIDRGMDKRPAGK